jgi:hypothetical protein
MYNFKSYIFICFLLLPLFVKAQNLPQNQVFNAANEVVLKIFGTDKNFDFRSDKFAGRYDNEQSSFEFILPVLSVYPLDETNDLNLVRDLFLVNKGQPVINLTASFKDPLTNVKDFKSPQELVLDGWLTIADRRYNIPVVMSLFYNNDILFYKLRTEIDMYQLNWSMPAHYRTFLTGMLQIQVNDGRWKNFHSYEK